MRKIKRRQNDEEKEFLLEKFTTLMFLITNHLKAQRLPSAWGLGDQKKVHEKELLSFLKKHGAIKSANIQRMGF